MPDVAKTNVVSAFAAPGPLLRAARWAVLALVAALLSMFAASIVARIRELQLVGLEAKTACRASPPRPTPGDAAGLAASGLTLRSFAALQVGKILFSDGIWFTVGAPIFVRRGSEPMGLPPAPFLVTSLTGVAGKQRNSGRFRAVTFS